MRGTAEAILLRVLLAALTLATSCMPALAVDWPTPPDKWWEILSPGDAATFQIAINAEPPTEIIVVIEVLSVTGSKITIRTKTTTDGKSTPEQTETIDVKGRNLKSSLPEYVVVTKIGEKVFEVDNLSLKCIEYLVKTYDTSTNICYSPELPIIFNDGTVYMENTSGGITSTMTLTEYTGKKLEITEKSEE